MVSLAYLGDRAGLVVDCGPAGRVMLRVPGVAALSRWLVGAAIGIGLAGAEPVAFPSSNPPILSRAGLTRAPPTGLQRQSTCEESGRMGCCLDDSQKPGALTASVARVR